MAVGKVFNPPPNWPPPPTGWQPPPAWEPDPSWGPAPEGWELFRRANPHPWLRSFGIATVVYGVVVAAALLGPGISDYQAGGLLASIVIFPGLATALLLRSRPAYWPWWKVLLCVLAWIVVFGLLRALGSLSDSAAATALAPR